MSKEVIFKIEREFQTPLNLIYNLWSEANRAEALCRSSAGGMVLKPMLPAKSEATTQSSTFYFSRASKNKKSLPFPTATQIKKI